MQNNNYSPILDVAMSYVKIVTPHLEDEETKEVIRDAFKKYLCSEIQRDQIAELLMNTIENLQPLERIDAILNASETPLNSLKQDMIDNPNPLRKKTRPWQPQEDTRLLAGMLRYGLDNWVAVAKFVGNGRTRAQCAQRWSRGLDPKISKDQWTQEDENKLINLMRENRNKGWTAISQGMGNRSDVQCRYHFLQMQRDGKLKGEFADLIQPEKQHTIPLPPRMPSTFQRYRQSQAAFNASQPPALNMLSPNLTRSQPSFPLYPNNGFQQNMYQQPMMFNQQFNQNMFQAKPRRRRTNSSVALPRAPPFFGGGITSQSPPPLPIQNNSAGEEINFSLPDQNDGWDFPAENTESDLNEVSFAPQDDGFALTPPPPQSDNSLIDWSTEVAPDNQFQVNEFDMFSQASIW